MLLPSYGLKKGKDGEVSTFAVQWRQISCISCIFRNRTAGDLEPQDSLIVPSLEYSKILGLGSSKFAIVDTIIYPLPLQHTSLPPSGRIKHHFDFIQQQLSVGTRSNQILTSLRQSNAEISLKPPRYPQPATEYAAEISR